MKEFKMKELELYYFPACPFCKKVLKFINRNNLDEQVVLRNIHEDPDAKRELKVIGGKEQVPCLFINKQPLYESNDIIKWFEENMFSYLNTNTNIDENK